jgi:formate-dependent nitrite reductase membrane component NrfD
VKIPNIGPRGQRQRLTFGVVSFGAAVLLGLLLFVVDAARPWRLALFVPLWIGALGVFQARDKT